MTQVFGEIYAPVYDLMYRDKNYDGETDLLEKLFRQYATQPIKRILDMGCGTGNHALRLAARGYEVMGLDRSADMLAVADRKARAQAGPLCFHQADIRNADMGVTFDAVLMMFAVLSYQLEDADVLGALQTARRHLRPDGLLVFDVWYGPGVVAQGAQERVRTIEQNGSTWVRTASGRLDTELHQCEVEIHLRHMQDDRVIEKSNEGHTVRYFFPEEISRFLEVSEFRLVRLGAFPALDREPDHTTWNVMAAAIAV